MPNQSFFINRYFEKDIDSLKKYIGEDNLSTWKVHDVKPDLEQLLIGTICPIDTKNVEFTHFSHLENRRLSANIKK